MAEDVGISLRMIRNYKPEDDKQSPTVFDQAFELALADQRDIPFAEKLDDALMFLISRIN